MPKPIKTVCEVENCPHHTQEPPQKGRHLDSSIPLKIEADKELINDIVWDIRGGRLKQMEAIAAIQAHVDKAVMAARRALFQEIIPEEGVAETTKGTFAEGYTKAVEDICNAYYKTANRMYLVCNVCLPEGRKYDYEKWRQVSFHVAKWYPGEIGEWYTNAQSYNFAEAMDEFFTAHAHPDKYPGGVENPVRLDYEWTGTPFPAPPVSNVGGE